MGSSKNRGVFFDNSRLTRQAVTQTQRQNQSSQRFHPLTHQEPDQRGGPLNNNTFRQHTASSATNTTAQPGSVVSVVKHPLERTTESAGSIINGADRALAFSELQNDNNKTPSGLSWSNTVDMSLPPNTVPAFQFPTDGNSPGYEAAMPSDPSSTSASSGGVFIPSGVAEAGVQPEDGYELSAHMESAQSQAEYLQSLFVDGFSDDSASSRYSDYLFAAHNKDAREDTVSNSKAPLESRQALLDRYYAKSAEQEEIATRINELHQHHADKTVQRQLMIDQGRGLEVSDAAFDSRYLQIRHRLVEEWQKRKEEVEDLLVKVSLEGLEIRPSRTTDHESELQGIRQDEVVANILADFDALTINKEAINEQWVPPKGVSVTHITHALWSGHTPTPDFTADDALHIQDWMSSSVIEGNDVDAQIQWPQDLYDPDIADPLDYESLLALNEAGPRAHDPG